MSFKFLLWKGIYKLVIYVSFDQNRAERCLYCSLTHIYYIMERITQRTDHLCWKSQTLARNSSYIIGLNLSIFQKFNINFRFLLTTHKLFLWYVMRAYFDAILCFLHYSCTSMIRSSIAEIARKVTFLT